MGERSPYGTKMFQSSTVLLKPSDILFSQDSINNYFDQKSEHRTKRIGETLDDICDGRCSISDIPRISAMNIAARWVTADNRRLWVFQNLERLGRCDNITAKIVYNMRPEKLNSTNGGKYVRVRRDPGGRWHLKVGQKISSNSSARTSQIPRSVLPTYTERLHGNDPVSDWNTNRRRETVRPEKRNSNEWSFEGANRSRPSELYGTQYTPTTDNDQSSWLTGILVAGAALIFWIVLR